RAAIITILTSDRNQINIGPYGICKAWTPKRVHNRIAEAFDVAKPLSKNPDRGKPIEKVL
ncbi:MAG: hypothetical protein ACE1ZE_05990, partial [Candidatus Binatia bacterium]